MLVFIDGEPPSNKESQPRPWSEEAAALRANQLTKNGKPGDWACIGIYSEDRTSYVKGLAGRIRTHSAAAFSEGEWDARVAATPDRAPGMIGLWGQALPRSRKRA
jgi:hypothetical protein